MFAKKNLNKKSAQTWIKLKNWNQLQFGIYIVSYMDPNGPRVIHVDFSFLPKYGLHTRTHTHPYKYMYKPYPYKYLQILS